MPQHTCEPCDPCPACESDRDNLTALARDLAAALDAAWRADDDASNAAADALCRAALARAREAGVLR